jgi:hypothetical protein
MIEQIGLPLDVADAAVARRWVLRRSTRARRLAVRIHHDGGVEVVVPRGVTEATVAGFLQRHQQWINSCNPGRRRHPHSLFRPRISLCPGLASRTACISPAAVGSASWQWHPVCSLGRQPGCRRTGYRTASVAALVARA